MHLAIQGQKEVKKDLNSLCALQMCVHRNFTQCAITEMRLFLSSVALIHHVVVI